MPTTDNSAAETTMTLHCQECSDRGVIGYEEGMDQAKRTPLFCKCFHGKKEEHAFSVGVGEAIHRALVDDDIPSCVRVEASECDRRYSMSLAALAAATRRAQNMQDTLWAAYQAAMPAGIDSNSLDEVEKEMNEHSSKFSQYLSYRFSTLEEELSQLRAILMGRTQPGWEINTGMGWVADE